MDDPDSVIINSWEIMYSDWSVDKWSDIAIIKTKFRLTSPFIYVKKGR